MDVYDNFPYTSDTRQHFTKNGYNKQRHSLSSFTLKLP